MRLQSISNKGILARGSRGRIWGTDKPCVDVCRELGNLETDPVSEKNKKPTQWPWRYVSLFAYTFSRLPFHSDLTLRATLQGSLTLSFALFPEAD